VGAAVVALAKPETLAACRLGLAAAPAGLLADLDAGYYFGK
jgi:hypothetical protein